MLFVGRDVLSDQESILQVVPSLSGQILEDAAQGDHVIPSGFVCQHRILLAQASKPAEDVGVTAQLRKMMNFRVACVNKAEETIHCRPIGHQSAWLQGSGHGQEFPSDDGVQGWNWRRAHGSSGRRDDSGATRILLWTA